MQKKSDEFSFQDAARLAQSPAGQEIMKLLRQKNAGQLQNAVEQATSGHYDQVQETLKEFVQDSRIQELLRHIGEIPHE